MKDVVRKHHKNKSEEFVGFEMVGSVKGSFCRLTTEAFLAIG